MNQVEEKTSETGNKINGLSHSKNDKDVRKHMWSTGHN